MRKTPHNPLCKAGCGCLALTPLQKEKERNTSRSPLQAVAREAGCGCLALVLAALAMCIGSMGIDPIIVGVIVIGTSVGAVAVALVVGVGAGVGIGLVIATSSRTPYVPHKKRGLVAAVGAVVVVVVPHGHHYQ